MAAKGAVIMKFLGDTASLEAAFHRVEKTSTQASSGFQKVHTAAKVAATALLGMGIALAKGAVSEAMKAQVAQASLTRALNNAGIATKANQLAIEDYAKAQLKRGFGDVEVLKTMPRLVSAFKSVTAATKMNTVAEDLARTKSISLASATDMVIKTHAGNTRALRSLGIVVKPVTDAVDKLRASHAKLTPDMLASAHATDKAATAQSGLVALMKITHGQADVFAGTDAGKIAVFRASWEHLQEEIGSKLLPVLSILMGKVNDVMGFIDRHKTTVEVLAAGLGGLAVSVLSVNKAMAAGKAIQAAAAAVMSIFTTTTATAAVATEGETVAQTGLNAAMRANPIGIVITAIALLATGFILAWKKSETFRDIVKGAFGVVKAIAFGVRDAVMTVVHAMQKAYDIVKDIVTLGGLFSHGKAPSAAIQTKIQTRIPQIYSKEFVVPPKTAKEWGASEDALAIGLNKIWRKAVNKVSAPKRASDKLLEMLGLTVPLKAFEANPLSRSTLNLAAAQLTPGLDDDLAALNLGLSEATKTLNAAAESGSAQAWLDAANNLKAARDALAQLGPLQSIAGQAFAMTTGESLTAPTDEQGNPILNQGGGFTIYSEAGKKARQPYEDWLAAQAPAKAATAMAAGGIVTSPMLAMIGESGPEAVVPLGGFGGGGGGGGGQTVNNYITINTVDPATAGTAVIRAIDEWERRNGARYARA